MAKIQTGASANSLKTDTTGRIDWQRFKSVLRAEVGEAIFNSWFGRLEIDDIVDDCAYLSVPTKFLKSWICSHFLEKLEALLQRECPGVSTCAINIRATGHTVLRRPPDIDTTSGPLNVTLAPATPVQDAPRHHERVNVALDGRMRFANFVVGGANQLAFAAAQQVALPVQSGETRLYNPLYIYSAVGLGKTHLAQAIAHSASDSGRKVGYLTAEKFMYGFVASLKDQSSLAFKDRMRSLDLVVIDDVQFLQGRSTQHEFCHTLNALLDAGKQVVIVGDRTPMELENLDERLKSRFAGGLSVEIAPPDENLRRRILESRIAAAQLAQPAFVVMPEVVSMVARSIQTNGRDLDGAVNRLLAHTTLAGAPLSLSGAESAIKDLVRNREAKKVRIEEIQKLVATHFNVSRSDMLSARRTANVVRPRQIAMYLSKLLTPRSLPEIGRHFGGRDHTTVLHAVRKIDGLICKDSSLHKDLESLKHRLTEQE